MLAVLAERFLSRYQNYITDFLVCIYTIVKTWYKIVNLFYAKRHLLAAKLLRYYLY